METRSGDARPPVLPERRRGVRPALARLWLMAHWPWWRRRYHRLTIEHIDDTPLVILPNVFNAVLFRGGELLARTIVAHPLFSQPGLKALDLGCGSGVVSVFAARRGADVVAVDNNPDAVRCARINALLNGVEAQVDVRLGDLFAPVANETFDLVVFNPPFYRGKPKDALDAAWRGEQVFEGFAHGLRSRLSPGGRAWVLLSSDGDGAELLALLRSEGFELGVVAERRWWEEVMMIFEATPKG
ncbi:MAG: methyltransferase [Caldilineales bacterium]|nr:methyltransferase [Caldilineales bacterium]